MGDTSSGLQDRFRGLMVGTAVGDCLGRPVEGRGTTPEKYLADLVERPPLLVYTDDTAMTICLAESLVESGGFDGDDMALRFATEYRDQPFRGYGAGAIEIFHQVLAGAEWAESAASQFGGHGSYGNGGAMRVAPVALWAHPDLQATAHLAAATARVTHTHPVGVEGAVIMAVSAQHALALTLDRDGLRTDLDRLVETKQFRLLLPALDECLEAGDDHRAAQVLGNRVAADRSVLTALYCFLLAEDFTEAVLRALRIGGDADTIAAMAGALAGARFGLSGIPESWRQVEAHTRLVDLADAIHSRRR